MTIRRKLTSKQNRFVYSFNSIKNRVTLFFSDRTRQAKQFTKRRPFTTFIILLAVLLTVIVVGDQLRRPEISEEEKEMQPKVVEGYSIGSVPRITVSGKIEKSGVITIRSQTGGIVQKINMVEGSEVKKGQTVVSLSSNYQGAVLPGIQRQISQTSYQFQKDTYDTQKEIIANNRSIAEKSDENADRLREITRDSRIRTREILDVSKPSLEVLEDLIAYYKSLSTATLTDSATDESVILGLKQQQIGLINGIAAAEQSLKSADYQESGDNAPARLSDLTREMTLKQLDLQEKTLDMNLEIASLNVQIATISESFMYPASPFSGRVERIHIKVGQSVNPGDPIATIVSTTGQVTVVALVSKDIAQSVSTLEPSILTQGDQVFELTPLHISSEPTDGRLFAVVYLLPQLGPASQVALLKGSEVNSSSALSGGSTDGQYVSISLPVGFADTNSIIPFIPLESVFQSQDESIVFVNESGTARARKVTLGYVTGRFVEVTDGLQDEDVVLLDRTLIEGDRVTVKSL